MGPLIFELSKIAILNFGIERPVAVSIYQGRSANNVYNKTSCKTSSALCFYKRIAIGNPLLASVVALLTSSTVLIERFAVFPSRWAIKNNISIHPLQVKQVDVM